MIGHLLQCSHLIGQDFTAFYNDTRGGKFVPRSVFVDLEPGVVDAIKVSYYIYLSRISIYTIYI